jgi:hypothetical protein
MPSVISCGRRSKKAQACGEVCAMSENANVQMESVSGKEERPPYVYPTAPLPTSVVDGLIGIVPPVGGDALADTEALYDEV